MAGFAPSTASMAFCAMVLPPVLGLFVDGEEPLHGEARLDDDAGALREADGVGVVLDGFEEAGGFEVGDDALACGVAVEAVVG